MNQQVTFNKVLLHKAKVIERCVQRAKQEYDNAQGQFLHDFTRQDAAILNLQRACEAALDMAQHVLSTQAWGMGETSKDLFYKLREHGAIDATLCTTLAKMVGFRNIAVHDDEEIDMAKVESIILRDSADLLTFSEQMLKRFFKSDASNHPI
jgi:uncharacterized protein YutE (UPF0331/DUF86 family)